MSRLRATHIHIFAIENDYADIFKLTFLAITENRLGQPIFGLKIGPIIIVAPNRTPATIHRDQRIRPFTKRKLLRQTEYRNHRGLCNSTGKKILLNETPPVCWRQRRKCYYRTWERPQLRWDFKVRFKWQKRFEINFQVKFKNHHFKWYSAVQALQLKHFTRLIEITVCVVLQHKHINYCIDGNFAKTHCIFRYLKKIHGGAVQTI